ncbi:MAG: VTT domain-containing protein [Syntrophobacteraceae bacterium]
MCPVKTKIHIQEELPDPGPRAAQFSGRDVSRGLADLLETVSERCIECGLCRKECRFLDMYGSPKSLADRYNPGDKAARGRPFECSLCRLCTAVCPEDVDPAGMFLEMRREAVRGGEGDYPEHSVILGYEKRGTSRRYSLYALPTGCGTVFFPGCTLPGTRPERVKELYTHLTRTIPNLGIVLDCCSKPSHDLGREKSFESTFGEMKEYLVEHGVRNVLVACPNCLRIFKDYGGELSTGTVYESLAENGLPGSQRISGAVTVHDPCAVRFEGSIHAAVRTLAANAGLTVEEMAHHGEKTLCCGEGGSVGFLSPELAESWRSLRKDEVRAGKTITYCAGCANSLGGTTPTAHILDLLFEPEATLSGEVKVSRAPVTYWNRIRLKSWFKKNVDAAVTRERTFSADAKAGRRGLIVRLLLLMVVVGAILAVHLSGATRYMEQETLRGWIEGFGIGAPLLYMLVYAVAPALFLPGLPITIAGGILFGPFWGVVYTITSSTVGACLAFLISRYLAGDWVEGKLKSPRWLKLDEEVQRHGWKVVAITRLIPLFPFNLLNYAFGLTKVRFLHYALATFFCMLPACVAFIVFSSSLLDVIRGKISPEFIIGVGLIVLVSLIPVFWKKRRK